jgi:tetratricopeptide (TPR) repeat protein
MTETVVREPNPPTPPEDRSDFVAQAEKLVREGHAEGAIAVLNDGIAVAPDRPDAWRVKARALRHLENFRKANEVIDTALKLFPEESGLLIDKGELHILQGNFPEASDTFGRLTKIEPQNAEGWLGRGQSLLHEKKAKQALACAEKVIELNTRSTAGYTLRGDCQLQMGCWDDAFASFAKAAETDASRFDSSSWTARGDKFSGYGQPEFALRAYERAIEQDPKNPEGWLGEGMVLKARGNIDGALAAFQRASEEDKAFITGFLDAGALCVERGDLDRALEFFERAKKARPNDARPWVAIGGIHERRLEYEEARTAYEQATKIDPEDAKTWNSLGNSLYQLDQLGAALQSYKRAIEVAPAYGWPHNNLAYVLLKLRRFEDAIQSIDRAVEIDPRNTVFWNNKFWVLTVAERIDEIDATAEQALNEAGDDVNMQVMVAGFLTEANRADRARNVLRDVQPSALQNDEARLTFAEILLVIGDTIPAVTLLRNTTSAQLTGSRPVVRSFLHLLADRLAEARLSEGLLVSFLREFGKRLDQVEAMGGKWDSLSIDWTYNGVRRLLVRCELPLLDKLVLTMLIDLQEAKIQRANLSFFADMWPSLR